MKTGMRNRLEKRLKNKTALVTGASRGIGRAIVERLSGYRMKIGLLARSEPELREVENLVRTCGSETIVLRVDLRDKKEVEAAADGFRKAFGTPDILINNAGIGRRGFWEDVTLDEEMDTIKVNYIAPLILIRYFLPDMIERRSGHIININTIGGIYTAPYQGSYCASKSALLAYAVSLGYELEKKGVHISSVFPGPVDTDFIEGPNFEGFKKGGGVASPYQVADKVLSVIDSPREMIYIGPFWKTLLAKMTNLHPCLFRAVIEKKNTPPEKAWIKG